MQKDNTLLNLAYQFLQKTFNKATEIKVCVLPQIVP